MKTATTEIEDKVDQLLIVLDKDIQHIVENLSRLNDLRGLVVKRDDVSLYKLLESIKSESNSYKENELKRQSLREELAIASNCSLKQMTLSRLEAELSGEKKAEVAERKTKLQTLAEKLKKELLSTTMLLSDCARFNSMLLKSVFEFGQAGTITYSPKGSAERQTNSAFVNLQF
ncbi:MAG: hypothetical protein ACYSSL_04650 [Planctomycetota bacterium]|jgi:hypothetical protein